MHRRSVASLLLLLLACLGLARCASLGYYGQAVRGGWQIFRRQEPIPRLLADPAVDPELKARLRTALEIREFAVRELALPDNRSYRSYADLGRPYAVWTVVAAPELSLEPLVWCFPVAGCVTYRGYFRPARAERFAARLAAAGYDVDVGGVAAYSTLGRLRDPLLNTFIAYPEADLAGLVFHELAHQEVYAGDDTTFNESFATLVESEGVRRWLAARGRAGELAAYEAAKHREEEVVALLLAYRERLAAVYAAAAPDAWKRERKGELLAALAAEHAALAAGWEGGSPYAAWFAAGLDNARLASIGAYHELVPAFAALLAREGGDLAALYRAVRRLARLPAAARRAELAAGVGEAPTATGRPASACRPPAGCAPL